MGAQFLVGIDFGTTNTTMAYTALGVDGAEIQQFEIPQITAPGTETAEMLFPSTIYFPLAEELNSKQASISWAPDLAYCAGRFARDRGAELPGRLVWSAKSWLCQAGVDRRSQILPLEAEDAQIKISPVDACTKLFKHLMHAWNSRMKEAPFLQQKIIVTVPASFDPNARQLIIEAAEKAGYPEITLLEEPQAAFYSWLNTHDNWRKDLKIGDRVLVVDIGGGTTDFSLISVANEGGNLQLERTAVGSHLLLGGDNIDLALAYYVKEKLEDAGHDIDDWQLQAINHACRSAKEQLLSANPPESVDIAVMGRGSRLIGGLITYTLKRDDVLRLILDGFLPVVGVEEQSKMEHRSGIQQLGLTYAQDARITSQLAKFLAQTNEGNSGSVQNFQMPTVVLFNGGTTKAAALRERLLDQLKQWSKTLEAPEVRELPKADYDFAVSRGAVCYGLAREGSAIRIKSGTSRSYYIGIEDAVPAVPGQPKPMKAVCIVPFGMEEGTECTLEGLQFALTLGEPATFRFFSCATPQLSDGRKPVVGDQIKRWKQELTELHPIETSMEKNDNDGRVASVRLQSKVTELGVLELSCLGSDDRRWSLEFDIRK